MKVWLDVDTGVDDAHAILLALRSPELDVLGISCVAGNSTVDKVVDATLKVCDAAEARPDLPIGRGCAHPLIESLHPCPEIHGVDSLGDLNPPLPPSKRQVSGMHGVSLLLHTLESCEEDHCITIIALAPLTNLACALRHSPETVRKKVSRVVWMGGACCAGGNATSWAEANSFYDPEAAHAVLSSGIPVTMYTWDVYLKVEFSRQDLADMGHLEHEVEGSAAAAALKKKEHERVTTAAASAASASSLASFFTTKAKDDDDDDEDRPPPPAASSSDSGAMLGARLLFRDMRHWDMAAAQIGDGGTVAALLMLIHAHSADCGGGSGASASPSLTPTTTTSPSEEEASSPLSSELSSPPFLPPSQHSCADTPSTASPSAAVSCTEVVTKRMHVAVELKGEHTRGMTVCDLRPCVFAPDKPCGPLNVDVVVDVDGPALAQLYANRVLRPPPHCTYALKAAAAAKEKVAAAAAAAAAAKAAAAGGGDVEGREGFVLVGSGSLPPLISSPLLASPGTAAGQNPPPATSVGSSRVDPAPWREPEKSGRDGAGDKIRSEEGSPWLLLPAAIGVLAAAVLFMSAGRSAKGQRV